MLVVLLAILRPDPRATSGAAGGPEMRGSPQGRSDVNVHSCPSSAQSRALAKEPSSTAGPEAVADAPLTENTSTNMLYGFTSLDSEGTPLRPDSASPPLGNAKVDQLQALLHQHKVPRLQSAAGFRWLVGSIRPHERLPKDWWFSSDPACAPSNSRKSALLRAFDLLHMWPEGSFRSLMPVPGIQEVDS